MHTRTIDQYEIISFQVLAERAALNKGIDPSFYSIRTKAGSMLVDRVNGDPYVVDFNEQKITVFASVPGSGTDKHRQRVKALMFFEDLAEQLDLLRAA